MEKIGKIMHLGQKVLNGQRITITEAAVLAESNTADLPFLFSMANKIRHHYRGDTVEMCAITNGRSGYCSEDCRFCAQSSFYKTNIETYSLKEDSIMAAEAKKAKEAGAVRFSIVTSGRGLECKDDFSKMLRSLARIKSQTGLKICASLGILSRDQDKELKAAGVSRYHHNIETSRSFFQNICSTHTYDARLQTIKIAQEAGLEVCSGGIIGLGESLKQRLEMAFELQAYDVQSVPINVLTPILGTPLQKQPPLKALEILKTFALFRFILPDRCIRTAGGRETSLRDLQSMALLSGANAMLIGGYLTTRGRDAAQDLQMVKDLERSPGEVP